jgi:hypothetical protein
MPPGKRPINPPKFVPQGEKGIFGPIKKISNAIGLTNDRDWQNDATDMQKAARTKRLRGKGG